jgi:hypothetical protein
MAGGSITTPTILPARVANIDSNSAADQNTQSSAENQNYQNAKAMIGGIDNFNDSMNSMDSRISGLEGSGAITITNADSPYTITDATAPFIGIIDSSGGNVNVILPTLAANQGRSIDLYHLIGGNNFNVDGEGAETIEGMTDVDLPKQGDRLKLAGRSAEWQITDERISCQLRLDTYAGYGSTDTKIVRFTNSRENYGNIFSENHSTGYNGNTEGIEITINKSGVFSFSFSFSSAAGTDVTMGLSLDSSQLTTNIESINVQDRLVFASDNVVGYGDSVCWSGYLAANSVVRAHTNGVAPNNSALAHFTATYSGN